MVWSFRLSLERCRKNEYCDGPQGIIFQKSSYRADVQAHSCENPEQAADEKEEKKNWYSWCYVS